MYAHVHKTDLPSPAHVCDRCNTWGVACGRGNRKYIPFDHKASTLAYELFLRYYTKRGNVTPLAVASLAYVFQGRDICGQAVKETVVLAFQQLFGESAVTYARITHATM